MITQKSLGEKLKVLRDNLGFSQDYVAKELGINRQAIIGIESGVRKIDSFELLELSNIYGISIKDLFESEQPVPNLQNAVLCLRNRESITEDGKKAILDFQKIIEDYEFLKRI